MVVHFPIVFALSLAAFDGYLVSRGTEIGGRGSLQGVSTAVALAAGLSALAAFAFGDMAMDIAMEGGVPESRIEMHETLGSIAAIALAVWAAFRCLLWWRDQAAQGAIKAGLIAGEIAICALIIATAYAGGDLVYQSGVNVSTAQLVN